MADPFTLEIITNILDYAGEEMFLVFGRTAKSPVIYEVLDYAVAISDSQGDLVAIAPGVPGFAGILDYTVKEVLEKYGRDGIKPGDIFANNIPYRSGTHLNDVTLIKPVFYRDEIAAFTVAKGHWSEVGGMRFGSWTSDATEIYQEGLQLPNVKLYVEGRPNRDIIDIIRENSRLPSLVLGDMEAQIAALRAGERRILEAIDKYGYDAFVEAIDKIHRDARRKSLMHLSKLPKGEFEAEDYIDDDGITDDPVYVRVKVTISEDKFVADFTGSAPQTKGPINSPYPGTVTAVRIVYLAITDPHERLTTSYFSPLRVIAPEGTVFNPTKPAPTSTFWESMMFASDLVWKALAEHVPHKLTAGHFNTVGADILGGVSDRTGEPFAIVEPNPGGWGAGHDRDGESALVCIGDGETYAISIEVAERRNPVIVDRYELNTEDGTGHGKYRGGFGIIKDYRIANSSALFTGSYGRFKYPPWGVAGGFPGTRNYVVIIRKDGRREVRGRVANVQLSRDDVVSIRTGGGGGWGDPLDRDPVLVLWDVVNEYITPETARKVYGVVVDPETRTINWQETRKLRQKMREERGKR